MVAQLEGFGTSPGCFEVVMEEAERFRPDLIVMAASGRSRVARFFVPSSGGRQSRASGEERNGQFERISLLRPCCSGSPCEPTRGWQRPYARPGKAPDSSSLL